MRAFQQAQNTQSQHSPTLQWTNTTTGGRGRASGGGRGQWWGEGGGGRGQWSREGNTTHSWDPNLPLNHTPLTNASSSLFVVGQKQQPKTLKFSKLNYLAKTSSLAQPLEDFTMFIFEVNVSKPVPLAFLYQHTVWSNTHSWTASSSALGLAWNHVVAWIRDLEYED